MSQYQVGPIFSDTCLSNLLFVGYQVAQKFLYEAVVKIKRFSKDALRNFKGLSWKKYFLCIMTT
jgi:hypothetical protein